MRREAPVPPRRRPELVCRGGRGGEGGELVEEKVQGGEKACSSARKGVEKVGIREWGVRYLELRGREEGSKD